MGSSNMYKLTSIILLLLFCCTQVFAVDLNPVQEKNAAQIFRQTMSPFCPGKLLDDCPSSKAMDLRNNIREQLAQGKSNKDVQAYLVSLYGESVKAAPDAQGFGRLAYIATPIFILIGIIVIGLWLRSQKHLIKEID